MSRPVARAILQRSLPKPSLERGAFIRRPIGQDPIREFMPFLLLDDIETKGQVDGFGDHPHRGQETMTYMFEGSLIHQDSNGNKGTLAAGDFQAMRAGRGIFHNETPVEDPVTHMTRALQLWVALPEANLNEESGYRDVISADCPVAKPSEGVSIKVIAGESFDSKAPMLTRAAVWYLDISLAHGTEVSHHVPKGWNVFAIVLEGKPVVAGKACIPHETSFFRREGDFIELSNREEEAARVVLVAGDPLDGQQVHRYGPFVSTSRSGINKAKLDYGMGTNGFEGSSWRSKPVHT